MRLFCAADTDPILHPVLSRVSESLRKAGAEAKWTPPAQWHVTLKFLGEVDARVLEPVTAAFKRAAAAGRPAALRLAGVGVFGGLKPRVVFAKVEEDGGHLQSAAAALDREFAPLGFHPDNHVFNPHVTLARVRSPRNAAALLTAINREAPAVTGAWEVRELVLYESILRPEGAEYRVVARAPLSAPGVAQSASRARL